MLWVIRMLLSVSNLQDSQKYFTHLRSSVNVLVDLSLLLFPLVLRQHSAACGSASGSNILTSSASGRCCSGYCIILSIALLYFVLIGSCFKPVWEQNFFDFKSLHFSCQSFYIFQPSPLCHQRFIWIRICRHTFLSSALLHSSENLPIKFRFLGFPFEQNPHSSAFF